MSMEYSHIWVTMKMIRMQIHKKQPHLKLRCGCLSAGEKVIIC